MNGVIVRPVEVSDYCDIYLLNQELGYFYPKESVKERITYITQNTKDVIFVAELDHEVVGYIHGSPYELLYSDSLINILGFVVKAKYRNLGIGGLLIDSLECWARENKFSGIRLVSGMERADAHRFYEKHGYTSTKNQKNLIKKFDSQI